MINYVGAIQHKQGVMLVPKALVEKAYFSKILGQISPSRLETIGPLVAVSRIAN